MFDGVHLGHQAVLAQVKQFAQQNNVLSSAITFREPPIKWTSSQTKIELLSILEERLQLFKDQGLQEAIVLDFPQICKLSPRAYFELLHQELACQFLAFGPNHFFGKDRAGNPTQLQAWAQEAGIQAALVNMQAIHNEQTISSSHIRHLVKGGNLSKANELLGHNFLIIEELIEGQKLGRKLGYPTLNFNYPDEKVPLPLGVYAAWLKVKEQRLACAINYGFGPTLKQIQRPVLECHLLQPPGSGLPELGQKATIELVDFIRPEKKFASPEALKEQIGHDCQQILVILGGQV